MWNQVFGSLDQRYLDWNQYCLPLINKIIAQLPCDIMCFQELESLVFSSQWQTTSRSTNTRCFTCTSPIRRIGGNKPVEHMDRVGIFVNRARFDVQDHRQVVFRDYILQHKQRFDFTPDFSKRVVLRKKFGLLLKLLHKTNNQTVYVTNTHLYWLPFYNDVKLLQTKLLVNELYRFIANDHCDPATANIVMCGDFSSTPDLMVYDFLAGKPLDVEHSEEFGNFYYGTVSDGEECVSELKNNLSILPAYSALLKGECAEKLDFTSFSSSLTAVLYQIWFSSGNFQVCKLLGKVDPAYCANALGFPDKQFPSDHIPVVAQLSYL